MPQSVISSLSYLRSPPNPTVLSAVVCRISSKSYCLVCCGGWNPIQIRLSYLPWCAESHPNPTVLSAVLCGIPSKSYCLVCRGVWNSIQILLSCLPWCVESPPNPTVLSAVVCGIPSKAYCILCMVSVIPSKSYRLVCHGVQNPIQILSSSQFLEFSTRYRVSQ